MPPLVSEIGHFLSYCGLTDARMRVSEKDLPVTIELLVTNFEL